MKLNLNTRLLVLRRFFTIYVEGATEVAKSGRKDEACHWYRFFRNSRILGLLADEEYGVLPDKEITLLTQNLRQLESACHPLDVPDFQTDLQAIRVSLSEIRAHLGIDSVPDLKVVNL